MSEFLFGIASATWLGLLTSISPCPLATNIAAISYLGREASSPRSVMLASAAYTFGRMATYMGLAAIALAGIFSLPQVSMTLQLWMNRILGPILIVVALILFGILWIPTLGGLGRTGERLQSWAAGRGWWGALILGALFAISFCPVSAALFFASLIPLSVKLNSWLLLPASYGVGTAIPVVGFAVVIGYGSHSLAKSFQRMQALEKWARRVTAGVMLAVGLYLTAIAVLPA